MADDGQSRLTRVVADSTRWRALEHFALIDSTNALAVSRARSGTPPGLVVVADHQTAGRGRSGRRWEDRPGGSLLMSCLVDAPSRLTLVPLAAGLAVADAVARAGAEPQLKWPNDVLVAGRKCAGVLVESTGAMRWLAIGMGVNTDWRGRAGTDSPATWTSLAEELDRDVDRWDVAVDLLGALEDRLDMAERNPDTLVDAYRDVCTTIGAVVAVETPAGAVTGWATDIDGRGSLLVRSDAGIVAVDAGDVRHLRPMP